MEYPTDCECTGPGWCERHRCEKSRGQFERCRRSPEIFGLYESGEYPQLKAQEVGRSGLEPCRHRGAQTRRVECESCLGRVQIKVFGCTKHGECSLSQSITDIATCRTCADFEAEKPE